MTNRIDSALSAKFQASCLNFNSYIKKLFGDKFGIDRHLSFSLQFSSISPEHAEQLSSATDLPSHIESFVSKFENALSEDQYGDQRYAYRVLFVQKTVNKKGQADKVVEFVKVDSDLTKSTNEEYEKVYLKEVDRKKYLAREIIKTMQMAGYVNFGMTQHTNLWKEMDAKNPKKAFAGQIGQQWHWFDSWVKVVQKHCEENKAKYGFS